METLNAYLATFLQWLVKATLQGSLLVCLIMLIQVTLRERLPARWRYCLWLVLLLRLSLPWSPQSPVSIYRVYEPLRWSESAQPAPTRLPAEIPTNRRAQRVGQADGGIVVDRVIVPKPMVEPSLDSGRQSPATLSARDGAAVMRRAGLLAALPLLWLIGVVGLGGYVLARSLWLWQAVVSERPVTDQQVLDLLEDCKMQMRVKTIVGLVVTDRTASPALFGFVRPRILLPQGLLETVGLDDLQYVFLHELAHLKRRDIYLAWLVCLLQILHWFNPLIWYAFRRMRADQEIAADALALSTVGTEEPHLYGRTIVNLLERFSRPQYLPSLAGILESPSHIERRMTMIARFTKCSYRWSPLAVVLIALVACLALPDARQDVVAAAGSSAGLTSTGESVPQPVFQQVRIINKIPWDAALSPDGKAIAFVSEDKLWIMPSTSALGPDYAGTPRLVETAEVKVAWAGLAWSGDGRWIAFNSMKEELKGNGQIYVVSAEGGKPREVHENFRDERIFNYRMSLSPDGKTLAFSSVDGNDLHIYTLPVEGGTPTRLVEAQAREPVFSPDGKMIAYVDDKALGRQGGALWVVPAEGGTARRVADAGNATSPVWSPDGKMIAFLDRKGEMEMTTQIHIVSVDQDGGNPGAKTSFRVPGVDEVNRLTGWTPDNKIGMVCKGHLEFGLYTLPAKGGATTLVQHGTYAAQPRWSPDGKRILFATNTTGSSGGWLMSAIASIPAEGGELTSILIPSDNKIRKPPYGSGNRVSPDGKTIVFAGRKAGDDETFVRGSRVSHIWTIPLEGGKPVQLTNAGVSFMDWCPCWSPDGKTIAFVRVKDSPNMAEEFKEANIWLVPAAGGEPRQLTSESDAFVAGSIAWSPDGRLLAYFSADKEWSEDSRSLRVIPVKGGRSRTVGKVPAIGFNTEMAWSPDSKRIAFNAKLYEKVIKVMSVDDGRTVDIKPDLTEPSSIWHLDWSRDGSRFVFAGDQGSSGPQFWMMEKFLPASGVVDESK